MIKIYLNSARDVLSFQNIGRYSNLKVEVTATNERWLEEDC